jgi:hypothetical protein
VSDVVVAATLIDLIRDGLRGQISVAAGQLVDAELQLGAREHPERYREPLAAIDSLSGLLEQIGWSTPAAEERIDLDLHGWALLQGIDDRVQVLIDRLAEIDRHGSDDVQPRAAVAGEASDLCKLALATMTLLSARQADEPTPTGA